jgi:hypothetical protein
VGWSLTATNAQDQVTSERGGPSPYRAVEPWLLLLLVVVVVVVVVVFDPLFNPTLFLIRDDVPFCLLFVSARGIRAGFLIGRCIFEPTYKKEHVTGYQ